MYRTGGESSGPIKAIRADAVSTAIKTLRLDQRSGLRLIL